MHKFKLITYYKFHLGRVAMSMTTLLTLSSMFNALTTITPPISYVTQLDIWMICCICFIFLTLFEFTVVIFLKYYLRYLPTLTKSNSNSIPSSGKGKIRSILDIKSHVQNWVQVRKFKKTFKKSCYLFDYFSE